MRSQTTFMAAATAALVIGGVGVSALALGILPVASVASVSLKQTGSDGLLKFYSLADPAITGEIPITATPTRTPIVPVTSTPAPTSTVATVVATPYVPPSPPSAETTAEAQARATQILDQVVATQTAERTIKLPGS